MQKPWVVGLYTKKEYVAVHHLNSELNDSSFLILQERNNLCMLIGVMVSHW
jgi:hypothetical protein